MNEPNNISSLEALRNEIDATDRQIVELFKRRMDISDRVAEYKKVTGKPVTDAARERELLLKVAKLAGEGRADECRVLYSTILALSRSEQQRVIGGASSTVEKIEKALKVTPSMFPDTATVACQGVEGAYSQIAAQKLFALPEITYCPTFEGVFEAIESGECRYGVVPIENSIAGTVSSVYDLMHRHSFYIVRSVRIKVDHCLLSVPGAGISGIKHIYSHEQAINQCSEFLSTLSGVTVTPCANTAAAAKAVAKAADPTVAALSSSSCAGIYGLVTLATAVQNNGNNHTRFICISREPEIYPGASRTTVMTVTENRPGALYTLLSQFFALGINLVKLESRPIPERDFEFMFCFDLETPVYSQKLMRLLRSLESGSESFRYLGSYSETV